MIAADLDAMGQRARLAAKALGFAGTKAKDRALGLIATALLDRQPELLAANEADMRDGEATGMSAALLDRLLLTPERLAGMAADVWAVAALPDPVGEMFDVRTLPSGLTVGRKRVPLGVVAAIYESRPNVTIDIAALCLKSGNAVILRGGREALRSCLALAEVLREVIGEAGLPQDAVQYVSDPDRSLVDHLLTMRDAIDLLVPRGGAELIRFVAERATMPVVTGGIGVCHTYVDAAADLQQAVRIAYNAKVRRPTICNALDTLLIHRGIVAEYLPLVAREWAHADVAMRCDAEALAVLAPLQGEMALELSPAQEDDWGKEFLALVAAVKVVGSLDEALEHIARYGSGHSEAIVTEDYSHAMRFLNEVDAAAVYVNASTQFTDGAQFGLGAEVGISTQKFHARGPMGLRELTSYKWLIFGQGQVRP